MATVAQWVEGARPRTLGAAVSPVLVGTAAASLEGPTIWWRAAAALGVALGMQVGVNYANDYSDGVRGTDAERKGPLRLTAAGLAAPGAVKRAAVLAFGFGGCVGALLAVVVDWRILIAGAAGIAAGALYSGGPRPYGYAGWGEVMVLIFFGFVATAGSAYVQVEHAGAAAWWGSLAVGLPAVGILLANNLRDVDTDRDAGKRTLAVRWGSGFARSLYAACTAGAFLAVVVIGTILPSHRWALLGLGAVPFSIVPLRLVMRSGDTPSLVRALVGTARFQVVLAALLSVGLWTS